MRLRRRIRSLRLNRAQIEVFHFGTHTTVDIESYMYLNTEYQPVGLKVVPERETNIPRLYFQLWHH